MATQIGSAAYSLAADEGEQLSWFDATMTLKASAPGLGVINTPGGFERMFELAPKTVEEAVQALNQYGVEVVGPHPRNG